VLRVPVAYLYCPEERLADLLLVAYRLDAAQLQQAHNLIDEIKYEG
jgi:hypothetical protein